MDSKDIRIVINGQAFRVEGDILRPESQSSFQQEVLRRLDGIESRLVAVEQEQRLLNVKIDGLQTFMYWTLGTIAAVFTLITLPAALSSMISLFRKPERQQADTQSITASLAEAFMKGLSLGRKGND